MRYYAGGRGQQEGVEEGAADRSLAYFNIDGTDDGSGKRKKK